MAPIDIFSIIVLVIMIFSIIGIVVVIGVLPGRIAKQRNHPQAEAIAIGSWVTLVFGMVFWPVILIWAYIRTDSDVQTNENTTTRSKENKEDAK